MFNRHLILTTTFALATACAPTDPSDHVATSGQAVAPPGSDAAFVSHTIPLVMNPGERLNVSVTMQNTGATPGTNDWTTAYNLRRYPNTANPFSFVFDSVTGTVPVGTSHEFFFLVVAPTTPGTYNLGLRMFSSVTGQAGYFGEIVNVTIVVDPNQQRRWACTFEPALSTLPAQMNQGETRTVNVTVRNTGTGTWQPTSFTLRSRDDVGPSMNFALWGTSSQTNNTPVTAPVAPGATHTFTFNITAPATAGTYSFLRQMFSQGQPSATGGIGFFDTINHCVNRTITVGNPALFDAALISENFPRTMAPGETVPVTVIMENTGSGTWVPSDFRLYYDALPRTFWGVSNSPVTVNVAPGQRFTFNFNITAPTTPGNYTHLWRMRKLTAPNAGRFGELISIPVTVNAATTPTFGAEVVSQNIPAQIPANTVLNFEITFRNSGDAAWTGSNFQLFSVNDPTTLWNTVLAGSLAAGETVAPGGTRTFTFEVRSPATPGTYDSRWQMREQDGVGLFGDVAVTTGIIVGDCGNGVVDPGETCDDGNQNAGDGCSATCQVEGQTIDLGTAPAGRTFIGSVNSGQLANVAIGDVTNDGVLDVVMAEVGNVVFPNGVARVDAGRVAGYSGVGFFNGATTSVPTGSTFQVIGAEANDGLGGGVNGGVEIGDVTGDGIADLVVSAGTADGPANTRPDVGQVYVLRGGAGLTGLIDLGLAPPTQLVATIVGDAAGDNARILTLGDLTGDGIADLVIGSPGNDVGGTDAGAVYVIRGGATLTGTITLDAASPSLYGRITGAAAGDQIGLAAAVGDFGGTAANDLVIASQVASPLGRTRAGAAWGFFNPVGNIGLPLGADVTWFGTEANDRFGTSVAIGNVRGTARADVVIGAIQANDELSDQVGSVYVWDGPVAPGTIDLGAGAMANTRILGIDANDDAGRALHLGDINGDGFLDIPVIASQADGPGNTRDRSGELRFILGAAALGGFIDLDTTPTPLLIYGPEVLGRMGHYVQSFATGDINGGNDDFCIGSFRAGTGGMLTSPGRIDCFSSPF